MFATKITMQFCPTHAPGKIVKEKKAKASKPAKKAVTKSTLTKFMQRKASNTSKPAIKQTIPGAVAVSIRKPTSESTPSE